MTQEQFDKQLNILKDRFEQNKNRHPEIEWNNVKSKLDENKDKLEVLYKMEHTGGEPDVVHYNKQTDEYAFVDCSPESPMQRRSLCYDNTALDARKKDKPKSSAWQVANEIGIKILNEQQYFALQNFGDFDLKSSSWIDTPEYIRTKGAALFANKAFDRTFVYYNVSADSYYSARGFRGFIKI